MYTFNLNILNEEQVEKKQRRRRRTLLVRFDFNTVRQRTIVFILYSKLVLAHRLAGDVFSFFLATIDGKTYRCVSLYARQ